MGQVLSRHRQPRSLQRVRDQNSDALHSAEISSTCALAQCLAFNSRPVVLSFLSPSCALCASVKTRLELLEEQRERQRDEAPGAPRPTYTTLHLDASNTALWGPEIVHYNVDQVPCFVVLDRVRLEDEWRVVGKTVCVSSADGVLEALEKLLSKVTY
jgi:hypothetical protein